MEHFDDNKEPHTIESTQGSQLLGEQIADTKSTHTKQDEENKEAGYTYKKPQVKKSAKKFVLACAIVCVAFIGLSTLNYFFTDIFYYDKDYDSIAVLYIEGVIQQKNKTYNQEWLLNTIHDLTYNYANKGLLLFINSPGGSVYESDEIYSALLDYKQRGKPLWAYLGPMAASGGYYIACAADVIYANRNTLTGSIGVIAGQSIDLTDFFEEYGIKMTTFTAGKNKNMLNIDSPLTAEQSMIMQSIADECYDTFTGIVAESRHLPLEAVHQIADGRVYTANQALEHGLIDYIGTFDNAQGKMQAMSLDYYYMFKDFMYKQKPSIYDLWIDIRTTITGTQGDPAARLFEKLSAQQPRFPAYFYSGQIR